MSRKISTLAILSLLHMINDANVLLIPTVLPLIVNEFGLSYLQVGLLLSSTIALTIILQTPLGYFSDMKGRKYLLSLGFLILGFGSILSSFARTFIDLLIAQVILSIGGSFYHPLSYAITAITYESRGRGRSIGIQSSMGDIGVLIIFATNGYIATELGWRLPIGFFGAMSIGASILPLLIEERSNFTRENAPRNNFLEIIRNISSLIGVQFLLVASYRIVYGYTSLLLVEKGLNLAIANSFIAILTLAGIIGSIITGILIDRYGVEKILGILSLTGALSALLIIYAPSIALTLIFMMVLGFIIYGIYPCTYSLLSDKTSKELMGLSYGLLLSIGLLGGFLGTFIAGLLSDYFGLNTTYLLVSLFFVVMSALHYCTREMI